MGHIVIVGWCAWVTLSLLDGVHALLYHCWMVCMGRIVIVGCAVWSVSVLGKAGKKAAKRRFFVFFNPADHPTMTNVTF